MLKNFRTYTAAVEFYRLSSTISVSGSLRPQLQRAASSIVLNLAEGRGKSGKTEQTRFFTIALGYLRECQAILTLAYATETDAYKVLDSVAAQLYKLIQKAR